MQLHPHHPGRSSAWRPTTELDEHMRTAFALASERVHQAIRHGNLLTPGEALALAGPSVRTKETLYSIARDVAWSLGCDTDDLLAALEERYPAFRLSAQRAYETSFDS